MGQRRNTVAAGLAVAALTLSACGSGSGDATSVADKPKFEANTTMAKIAAAGTIKVGTKYDQPGFGLKGLDASQFDAVAQEAEKACPVSNAYRGSLKITLDAKVG